MADLGVVWAKSGWLHCANFLTHILRPIAIENAPSSVSISRKRRLIEEKQAMVGNSALEASGIVNRPGF